MLFPFLYSLLSLYFCRAGREAVPTRKFARYPFPKSLSSGKGLAFGHKGPQRNSHEASNQKRLPFKARPAVSGNPKIRFMFCTA